MEKKRIPLATPHMSDEGYEIKYIQEAFDTNWIAPLGPNVNAFEKEMGEVLGCTTALALVSGTASMHMALKLADVGESDIVFCQSLTFSATANPIVYQGAKPVFIDSEEASWNMSPEALERAFEKYESEGKKPKAVIVVNLYGIAANMKAIKDICHKHNTVLIEDAAESLGTSYHGQMTGTFGDYGIISFNGNKIITTSGGGMLICNTEDAEDKKKKALFWSTQARDNEKYYQHSELGFNYRMSNIVAGVGRGQLKVLQNRVEKKREIYNYYEEAFKDIDDITMMPANEGEQYCNCWLSSFVIAESSKIKPVDIINALEEENIEARHVWKPMHMQPFFSDCDYIDNGGVAEKLFEYGICLPSDTKMNDTDLERIVTVVKNLWK